jgi:hypothetical protein
MRTDFHAPLTGSDFIPYGPLPENHGGSGPFDRRYPARGDLNQQG